MSKAMLILDNMPDGCFECDLRRRTSDGYCYCGAPGCGFDYGLGFDYHEVTSLSKQCPLIDYPPHMKGKEYPDRITASDAYRKGLDDGWNALVDILDGVQTRDQET